MKLPDFFRNLPSDTEISDYIANGIKKVYTGICAMTVGDWIVHLVLIIAMFYVAYKNNKAIDFNETYGKFDVGKCVVIDYQMYPIVYRIGYTITIRIGYDQFANINLLDESKEVLPATEVVGFQYDQIAQTIALTSRTQTLESLIEKDLK